MVPENCGKLLDNLPRYVRTLKGSGINGKLLGYFLKMQSERLYVFKDTGSGNLRQNYLLTFQGTSELHRVSGINGKLFGYIPKCIRTLVRFQERKTSTSFFFRHFYGQDIKARISFQRPFQATESQVSLPSQCRRPLGVNTKCKPGDTRYSLASIRRPLEKRPRIYDKSLSD